MVSATQQLDAKVVGDQPCLTRMWKDGEDAEMESSTKSPAKAAARGNEASHHAWKLFHRACISTNAMWSLMILGNVLEQVNDERMFLKHDSRVERWLSHIQPWMTPVVSPLHSGRVAP